jgi:hypothetical protein
MPRPAPRSPARQRGNVAFGLIALLIVLLIVLYLAFGAGGRGLAGAAGGARQRGQEVGASIQTRQLTTMITQYYMTHDELPRTLADMDAPPAAFLDPWGNPLSFTFQTPPGQRTQVTIRSHGPDGIPNTEDDIIVVEELIF